MKITLKRQTAVRVTLIAWFVIAMVLQYDVGLADNGDFTRSMSWISNGPVGIEPNWPASDSEDMAQRFFNYWIPYWKLDWNLDWPGTSALILWLPGALLNYILYSTTVLYLPFLALFSKLVLFCMLLLLFHWIEHNPSYKTVLLFSMGVPMVLIFTNADYIAYFNSFYQESASLIFLFIFFSSILLLKRYVSFPWLVLSLVSVLLLAMAKPANLYWPVIAVPFVLYVWSIKRKVGANLLVTVNLLLILLFTSVSGAATDAGSTKTNPYHSLFVGVLAFSEDSSTHLREMGMEDATRCIDMLAFFPIGYSCLIEYQDRISFKSTVRVIFWEPQAAMRTWKHALDHMQDISLDHLGRYSLSDPRSKMFSNVLNLEVQQERYQSAAFGPAWLNSWSLIKFGLFPTGYTLALTLIAFLTWFTWKLRDGGLQQDLALVGLISTVACLADSLIAIFGDGKSELIKHLFLSNLLFDIALVTFLNSLLLFFLEREDRKVPIHDFGKP